jgi:hypothetical protein
MMAMTTSSSIKVKPGLDCVVFILIAIRAFQKMIFAAAGGLRIFSGELQRLVQRPTEEDGRWRIEDGKNARNVPQVSQPAVSRVSKPAWRLSIPRAHELSRPADVEIGDTADLEVCGTGLATLRHGGFDSN